METPTCYVVSMRLVSHNFAVFEVRRANIEILGLF